MFDLSTIPRHSEQLILVTDKLQSPAEFVLHRIIQSHLQDPRARVIIATCTDGLSHWKATAAKMSSGINLTSRLASGSVIFFDELERISNAEGIYDTNTALNTLYDNLSKSIKASPADADAGGLLVLDGVSTFEWMGASTSHLKRFIRATFALCSKSRYTLAIRHHKVGDESTDDMLSLLLQLCSIHLEVLPLATGRSGSVSGEINALKGSSHAESSSWESLQRSTAIQYRLLDTGPLYFERGTSAGVL